MSRLFGASVLLAALAAFGLAGATAADKDGDKGWVQLFNGKDLTGWKIHPKPSGSIQDVVTVEKGGKVVAYEGKLTNGKQVPLWHVEDGVLIGSGPASHLFSRRGDYQNFRYRVEAQINATHGDKIRTGSLYLPRVKEVLVLDKAPHKPGEWFTQEVTAVGNHIVIKVNGKTTVDYKDPKNLHSKGHFALQGHDPGTVVKFRKIEVQELPAEK